MEAARARAALEELHQSVLAFDRIGARAWCAYLSRLAFDDRRARLAIDCAAVWLAIAEGRWSDAGPLAHSLEVESARAGVANLVVEAAALRALARAGELDLTGARREARRASRMATTESIPEGEYLAHLILARVRRLLGSPHLAIRILKRLRGVVPRSWRGWLSWEAAMSGALDLTEEENGPADALTRWLDTLERGELECFAARTATLMDACEWPMIAADAAVLVSSIDFDRAPDPSIAAWCSGATTAVPPQLHGILTRRGVAPPGSALGYVLVDGLTRRRVPRLALGLVDRARVEIVPQSRLKQGRTEMLVCALSLALEGLSENACFEQVYGFPFELSVHRGVFDVLVHRTRDYLCDRAIISRSEGRIRLDPMRPFVVADPRCLSPRGDSVLGILARCDGATARDLAASSRLSIRVVQGILQELVHEGMCLVERSGREVRYSVEDSTFIDA